MKKTKQTLTTLLALAFISQSMLIANTSFAEEPVDSNYAPNTYTPERKFHRGVANTFTGWMDAPGTIESTAQEDGFFQGATTGFARGVGLGIARMGVGIYDMLTFPYKVPDNYEPLMMPEYTDNRLRKNNPKDKPKTHPSTIQQNKNEPLTYSSYTQTNINVVPKRRSN